MTTRTTSAASPARPAARAPREPAPPAPRRRGIPVWAGVALLVGVSAVVRAAAATGVAAPWIGPDEPLYGLAGRTLLGERTVLTGAVPFASVLTPLLVGLPTLVLGDLAHAVLGMQVLQALAMSSTAAVVFAWARPLAGDRWGYAAAALSVVVPGMTYSGLLMTEALFYPLSALALWRLARLVERPTPAAHALFLGATALAVLTRLQAVTLLPAALLALLAAWALTGRRALLLAAAPYAALLGVATAAVAILVASGRAALGVYTSTVTGGYDAGAVLHDVWWHAGGVVLVSAGVPLVALGALLPRVRRPACPTDRLVALVSVAVVWVVVLVVQVGAFASQFVGHLAERDLLSAVPPLLVALAAWCAGGGASRAWTAAVALAVAAPAVVLPIARLATVEAMLDSPSTIALRKLAEHASEGTLQVVWPVAVAVAVSVPVLLDGRGRAVAVGLTASAFLVLAGFAQSDVRRASVADERWWFADAPPRWVDRAVDGPVTWVQAGTRNWNGFWKSAFWNRRVDTVVRFPGAGPPNHVRAPIVAPRFDGRLFTVAGRPVDGPYAVTPLGMMLDGRELARVAPAGDMTGLSLWRTDGPVRLRLWVQGLQSNGDLRGTAVAQLWDCRGGRLEVTLLGKEQRTLVAFDVSGGRRTSVPIGPNQVTVASVDLPSTGARCDVTITSPALVGTTRIERF